MLKILGFLDQCLSYFKGFLFFALHFVSVHPGLCLLGCVFCIVDYQSIIGNTEISVWKKVLKCVRLAWHWCVFSKFKSEMIEAQMKKKA